MKSCLKKPHSFSGFSKNVFKLCSFFYFTALSAIEGGAKISWLKQEALLIFDFDHFDWLKINDK